jgi:hypothetical protein
LRDRGAVWVDEDVDRGAHRVGSSQKIVVQSFFMLTTVQPCSATLASDLSAAAV